MSSIADFGVVNLFFSRSRPVVDFKYRRGAVSGRNAVGQHASISRPHPHHFFGRDQR